MLVDSARLEYSCTDDEVIAGGAPGAAMYDQNIRETSVTTWISYAEHPFLLVFLFAPMQYALPKHRVQLVLNMFKYDRSKSLL